MSKEYSRVLQKKGRLKMLSTKRINAIVSAMDAATSRKDPVGTNTIFQHVLTDKAGNLFATNTHHLIRITDENINAALKTGENFKLEIVPNDGTVNGKSVPDIDRVIPSKDSLKYLVTIDIDEIKQLKKEKKFVHDKGDTPTVVIDLTKYNLCKYGFNPEYLLTVAKAFNLTGKVTLEWTGKALQSCVIRNEIGIAVIMPKALVKKVETSRNIITCHACIDAKTGEILEAKQEAAPQMQEETAVEKAIEKAIVDKTNGSDEAKDFIKSHIIISSIAPQKKPTPPPSPVDEDNTPEETEAAAIINRLETDAARADSFASAAQGRGMTIQVKGMTTLDPIIWITGNTKPHKDWLKSQGAKWCAKKSAWYYHPNRVRAIRVAA